MGFEYKNEILSSRVGNLGASDANIIARASQSGTIAKSMEKRLAIAKGLIEPDDGFKTEAMFLGDQIEMTVYQQLKATDNRWQSNKLLTSKKYSKSDLKLIAHIDFFLQDDEKQVIRAIECKATKESTVETMRTYRNQLFVELSLLKEYAATLGSKWHVSFQLCHYDTNDFDGTFNPDKITNRYVSFRGPVFDINTGMEILNKYVAGMDCYYVEDDVNAEMLPAKVKKQFEIMTTLLLEINEREKKVADFKTMLYNFLQSHNIKSIKNDVFSITRVDPTTSISFDHKTFLADYANKHPTKYKRLVKKYEKQTYRKGYAKITIK